jgi:hypothetical protein
MPSGKLLTFARAVLLLDVKVVVANSLQVLLQSIEQRFT